MHPLGNEIMVFHPIQCTMCSYLDSDVLFLEIAVDRWKGKPKMILLSGLNLYTLREVYTYNPYFCFSSCFACCTAPEVGVLQ